MSTGQVSLKKATVEASTSSAHVRVQPKKRGLYETTGRMIMQKHCNKTWGKNERNAENLVHCIQELIAIGFRIGVWFGVSTSDALWSGVDH